MPVDSLPNQVYTVFSFIGFVMCAIPFYWHLESWNTGTCLYMAWTGLGCLIQCINSIVWNKNMVDKAPVYCDIVIRVQIGLNVAISACSLCINRRLYKIATAKGVITDEEKRRAVIVDLLIGLGIPILQIITEYIISGHRYNLFEDFGPDFEIVNMPPSYFLFFAWPLVIGCVSFVYSTLTIYHFYKRGRHVRQICPGISRSRYFRLMALASIDMFGSIPLATYFIVSNATHGVVPWKSWADTHSDYSRVVQIPSFMWKNDPLVAEGLEMYRWLLVACAFVFFAFFGFADEARRHYRLAYTSLVSRISSLVPSRTFRRASHVTLHMKGKPEGGIAVSLATTSVHKRDPTVSSTDQLSIPSTYLASDLDLHLKIEQEAPPGSIASSSVDSFEPGAGGQSRSPQPEALAVIPTVNPVAIQPDTFTMICRLSSDAASAADISSESV